MTCRGRLCRPVTGAIIGHLADGAGHTFYHRPECSVDRPFAICNGAGDTIAIQLADVCRGIELRRSAANVWIIA